MFQDPPHIQPSLPPGSWQPLVRLSQRIRLPLERFLHIEAASGILLLMAAALALIWVHSPWAEWYQAWWNTPLGITFGSFSFQRSLAWYVNDVLMVIFFFVVGLEIRREIHRGELSSWRRASLPAVAALGGMLFPAMIYLLLAGGPDTRSGWGVPMATDIAFAVGILTLLGRRVPPALRVLLLAVAVIDDLGAIIVIALFYSSGIQIEGLLLAGLGFLGVMGLQGLGVRNKLAYGLPAVTAWAGIYAAGVHPTIAGVILGLMTPVTPWIGAQGFLENVGEKIAALRKISTSSGADGSSGVDDVHHTNGILREIQALGREVLSPADSLIQTLHPWVAFVIMPVFALANSGVSLVAANFDQNSSLILTSVSLGLLCGKPLGILLCVGLALRLKLADLPAGITWRHLFILGVVAGVGFTMALFIAQLAFADMAMLSAAKIGILAASGLAGIAALAGGYLMLSPWVDPRAAQTADEAEASTHQ